MVGCSVFNAGLRYEIDDKRPAGTALSGGSQVGQPQSKTLKPKLLRLNPKPYTP